MQKNAHLITNVSRERWVSEMDKLLMSDNASRGLMALWDSGLMKFMFPEMELQNHYQQNSKYHCLLLDSHTANVVDGVPADLNLRWAAFLHDVGKPASRKLNQNSGYFNYPHHERIGAELVEGIALRLKWSNERRVAVKSLVRNHLDEDSPLKAADDAAGKDMEACGRRQHG